MADTAEIALTQPPRRWRANPAETVAESGTDAAVRCIGLVFTRNEVMREALGGRTWRGAVANAARRPCDAVVVQIRFHDRDGRPVGAPVTAHAARLGPGAALHLQARLPAAAAGMQVDSLRWIAGGEIVALGPFGGRPFDSVRD